MPLRVHCPNGCLVRMPENRAGKIVRCPGCKALIRVAPASKGRTKETAVHEAAVEVVELGGDTNVAEVSTPPGETPDSFSANNELDVLEINVKKHNRATAQIDVQETSGPVSGDLPTDENETDDIAEDFEFLKLTEPQGPAETSSINLKQRAQNSRSDRVVLAKVFAGLLCVVAAINLGPAIYYWMQWSQSVEQQPLSRWIYVQVFIAALHLVYAVFLIQIPDWSALKTVAIAMLGIAFMFGFVSTGLILGGGRGTVARFLEVPYSMVSQASIWCVAMLCLSTLMSYMCGKEAVNWQRAEQLLREIINARNTPRTTIEPPL